MLSPTRRGCQLGRHDEISRSSTAKYANPKPSAADVLRPTIAIEKPSSDPITEPAEARTTVPAVARSQAESVPAVLPRVAATSDSTSDRKARRASISTNVTNAATTALASNTLTRLVSHVRRVVMVPACHSAPTSEA